MLEFILNHSSHEKYKEKPIVHKFTRKWSYSEIMKYVATRIIEEIIYLIEHLFAKVGLNYIPFGIKCFLLTILVIVPISLTMFVFFCLDITEKPELKKKEKKSV